MERTRWWWGVAAMALSACGAEQLRAEEPSMGWHHERGGEGVPGDRAVCPAGYSCVVYALPCGSAAEAKATRDRARDADQSPNARRGDPAVATPIDFKDCLIAGIPVWRYDFTGFPVFKYIWNPDGQGEREATVEEIRAFREATKRPRP